MLRWRWDWLWSQVFPLNKNLWTSSYVLWTAGWAMLALALVPCADRSAASGRPLGRSFGVNAIAAYAGSAVMVYVFAALGLVGADLPHRLRDWMTPRFGPYLPSLAFALVFVAFWWLVVRGWTGAAGM